MLLTREDVCGIASYARIALTEEELTEMTSYMNDTIAMLAPILELDVEGIQPTFHPIGCLSNVMAEDELDAHKRSLDADAALKNAASVQDGLFRVPTILATD